MSEDKEYVAFMSSTTNSRGSVLVVGGGYVGLPLALLASSNQYIVYLYDKNDGRCRDIESGNTRLGDSFDEQTKQAIFSRDLRVLRQENLCELKDVRNLKAAVICVPTPTNSKKEPDLSAIIDATETISQFLQQDTLVILESSTYPGTTREHVLPILKRNVTQWVGEAPLLAYSPERIDPGNKVWNNQNTPRIVSGINKLSLELAVAFYENLGVPTYPVSSPEVAEAAKLFENTFRLVNISLVNEFANLMRINGLDVKEILDAANTKPFGIMEFRPSAGIGGHCIPVDPYYLTWWANQRGGELRIVKSAQTVNENMPKEAIRRAKLTLGSELSQKKILIVGVAYKPGVSDTRESPADGIWSEFEEHQSVLWWWDPLVESWKERPRYDATQSELDLVLRISNVPWPEFSLPQGARVLDLSL